VVKSAGGDALFAVVLAAGSASRYGRSKQLEDFRGTALVRRAAELARDVCGNNTILVTGHDGAAVAEAAGNAARFRIVNDRYAEGMGGSIAAAANVLSHVAGGMLLLLVDQPLITASHLRELRDTWSGADDEIVATSFAGTMGPPVLFPRLAFPALAQLSGDHGACGILRDARFKIKTIEFEDAQVDIDTPTDLATLEVTN
jgi:molybdenum cofactor cytidylyltransferase